MNDNSEIIKSLQADIEELQMRVVFQEDTVQSLNDIIARQDRQLSDLIDQVNFLAEKYKGGSSDAGFSDVSSEDERPPHY